MMKKPNFFIIGAPKCGTTSWADWLSDHQNVYMSPTKEPHFFDTDHKQSGLRDLRHYERLFRNAKDNHLRVGEASTRYLTSNVAVDNILEYNAQARFIVCLRNPIKMAYSLHQQEKFMGLENIDSFEKAWEMQNARANGKQIPFFCKDIKRLQYQEICSLGTQCEDLLKKVNREQILFLLLDDLKKDALCEYKKVLDFLGLNYYGRQVFKPKNTSKTYKYKVFRQLILFLGNLKKKLGINWRSGIYKWNIKKVEREPLSQEMRLKLEESFRDEIQKLEQLLDRDLSHWFQAQETRNLNV